MKKRELEVFFCPDYMAMIRPAPTDRPARDRHESAAVDRVNQWPEHVVFLTAKPQAIVEWAGQHLPQVAAHRVAEYVRTRNKQALSTLTESEMTQLREKNIELGTRLPI